jgi:thymidylate synthase (FAD)
MGIKQIKVELNPDVQPSGSDLAVANAARRSFNTRSDWAYDEVEQRDGGGEWITQKVNRHLQDKDKRLIEFLARGMTADDFEKFKLTVGTEGTEWLYYMDNNREHNLIDLLWQWRNTPTHDTPFNHCFISFEVQSPIFVRAQLVKHEYLIMSEFSRRYITDKIEFYYPDHWRKAAENKKQGSTNEPVDICDYHGTNGKNGVDDPYLTSCDIALETFQDLLSKGVAPEQARMVLPQSTMTEWTWSGTLGAFAKMCQLRLHPDAQYEARLVAQQVYDYLKQHYPVSAVALVEGVK